MRILEQVGEKNPDMEWIVLEPGESYSVEEQGITKAEFFDVLDKASQPIKREAESEPE